MNDKDVDENVGLKPLSACKGAHLPSLQTLEWFLTFCVDLREWIAKHTTLGFHIVLALDLTHFSNVTCIAQLREFPLFVAAGENVHTYGVAGSPISYSKRTKGPHCLGSFSVRVARSRVVWPADNFFEYLNLLAERTELKKFMKLSTYMARQS